MNPAQKYSVLLSKNTQERIKRYAAELRCGNKSGSYLSKQLTGVNLAETVTEEPLLAALLNTKYPAIFAESAVAGDGSDWTLKELGILGDISIAMPVTIFDNGAHQKPAVHKTPFPGHLIYTPGALLRNDQGYTPADWVSVTQDGKFDRHKYYALYERRLRPAFAYINDKAIESGKPAFVTIPGMGCGQFAGPFRGQMGHVLQAALIRFLETHGRTYPGIRAVYYDPYNECENLDRKVNGIELFVRPLLRENDGKSQLCRPEFLMANSGKDYSECGLYSFVAWDHVSWPGNDYYLGARMTDDGVKAAATDTMWVMTGIQGHYCAKRNMYLPPEGYTNWNDVVSKNDLCITASNNVCAG